MPRSIRLEYPGALYHVTARGVMQAAIFVDDRDRIALLTIVAREFSACDCLAFAFCLMGNHYHFVLQTRRANLSELMRRVNSRYSMAFNRKYMRTGHVFEWRFKAVIVDRDDYLLEVCRYVDLNPVRAGLVRSPEHWAWSSYRAHVGLTDAPRWLATEEMLGVLAGTIVRDASSIEAARSRYADWVEQGRRVRLWNERLREGRYLGDSAFIERVNSLLP